MNESELTKEVEILKKQVEELTKRVDELEDVIISIPNDVIHR